MTLGTDEDGYVCFLVSDGFPFGSDFAMFYLTTDKNATEFDSATGVQADNQISGTIYLVSAPFDW